MIGLEKQKVAIAEYDPAWPKTFDRERERVTRLLSAVGLSPVIEHVGSTAVRDLKAKPIIDVAVGLRDVREVQHALATLKAAGYDYVKPANQPGMLFMARGDPRKFHFHLVVAYDHAWRKLVTFRDHLRRHKALALEYQRLKLELADVYPDSRLDYTIGKKAFVLAVLRRALDEDRRRRHARAVARAKMLATIEHGS